MKKKVLGRIACYGIVLLAVGSVGGWFWWHSVPQQVERALRGVRHANARVASEAWQELSNLYFTKWAAVEPIVAAATDAEPISFLLQPAHVPLGNSSEHRAFQTRGRPVWYRADRVYCRTVGDAIRAMLYGETDRSGRPRWKKDFTGDWDAWWHSNKGYYGV